MKKHDESKSNNGIRRSKGKMLCKVISFTMVFVMLFCISASAETIKITVTDQDGKPVQIEAEETIEIIENETIKYIETTRTIIIKEEITNTIDQIETLYYGASLAGTTKIYERISINTNTNNNSITIKTRKTTVDNPVGNTNLWLKYNGEATNNTEEKTAILNEFNEKIKNLITKTNFEEIQVQIEPPVYEGFIGNARGLFDMLFESIQSIFNWLVSPNVLVFFGIGIILSITTIGILIARRFFWGR